MNTTIFSEIGSNVKVTGQFFVTYSATRYGRKYTTTHLDPVGANIKGSYITADELQEEWVKKYNGLCPFNGDTDFSVVKLQQRF